MYLHNFIFLASDSVDLQTATGSPRLLHRPIDIRRSVYAGLQVLHERGNLWLERNCIPDHVTRMWTEVRWRNSVAAPQTSWLAPQHFPIQLHTLGTDWVRRSYSQFGWCFLLVSTMYCMFIGMIHREEHMKLFLGSIFVPIPHRILCRTQKSNLDPLLYHSVPSIIKGPVKIRDIRPVPVATFVEHETYDPHPPSSSKGSIKILPPVLATRWDPRLPSMKDRSKTTIIFRPK